MYQSFGRLSWTVNLFLMSDKPQPRASSHHETKHQKNLGNRGELLKLQSPKEWAQPRAFQTLVSDMEISPPFFAAKNPSPGLLLLKPFPGNSKNVPSSGCHWSWHADIFLEATQLFIPVQFWVETIASQMPPKGRDLGWHTFHFVYRLMQLLYLGSREVLVSPTQTRTQTTC